MTWSAEGEFQVAYRHGSAAFQCWYGDACEVMGAGFSCPERPIPPSAFSNFYRDAWQRGFDDAEFCGP